MHGNCVLRLHAHAKRLSPPGVPLFGLACGHGTHNALCVIIAILPCTMGCVAACRVSAVLPYVVSTVVGSAGRRPSPTFANLLAWQKNTTGRAPVTNEPRRPPPTLRNKTGALRAHTQHAFTHPTHNVMIDACSNQGRACHIRFCVGVRVLRSRWQCPSVSPSTRSANRARQPTAPRQHEGGAESGD